MKLKGYFTSHGKSNFPIPSSNEPYVYLKSLANHPCIGSRIHSIVNLKLKT